MLTRQTMLGLSSTQPSQHTVGFIILSTVNPNFTIRTSQATDGFIKHSVKPSFIVSFSGCLAKDYTWPKHNKTQPIQYTIGFIRLLRQWKGRMTKLVAHSRAKDTSTRSIWPGIHITYIPNIRKHPLLCSIVPRDMPFLPVLFRECSEYLPATLTFS